MYGFGTFAVKHVLATRTASGAGEMKKVLLTLAAVAMPLSAMAADLTPLYKKALPPPRVATWTGFYGGLSGGLGGGVEDYDFNGFDSAVPTTTNGTVTVNSSGFFGGGQIGYNWQFGANVFGIETDIFGAAIKDQINVSVPVPAPGLTANASSTVDWFGTVRARLGWLPYDRLLVYGTGGLAYGGISSSYSLGNAPIFGPTLPLSGSFSTTRLGWTVGAGAEVAVTDQMSVKAEYLYVDLGHFNVASLTNSSTGDFVNINLNERFHTLKAGFNYRLGNPY